MARNLYGAVDIGGTKIAVGLVTAEGTVVSAAECVTAGPEAGLEWMVERLRGAVAIGVGCTGPVEPGTGRIGDVALLPGWKGFELVERLTGRLGVGVRLENDCDAAALGEAAYGAGRGCTRFLYVTV
ncbi:MAG: ROK family protein, partial [Acidobacteria bacterium]|nr:ROK family protein [Acidobacteriota bacterium]